MILHVTIHSRNSIPFQHSKFLLLVSTYTNIRGCQVESHEMLSEVQVENDRNMLITARCKNGSVSLALRHCVEICHGVTATCNSNGRFSL